MAIIHDRAALSPTALELIASWMPHQRWYAGKDHQPALTRVGGYLFKDPAGQVGIEVLFVRDDAATPPVIYQVPLTYRDTPDDESARGLIGTAKHSELGRCWIYDAPHDPLFAAELVQLMLTEGLSDEACATTGSGAGARGELVDAHGVHHVVRSRVLGGEQSNTSIVCDTTTASSQSAIPLIVKVFRTLQHGDNPDVVVQSALSAAGCDLVPTAVGSIQGSWRGPDSTVQRGHLAYAQRFYPGVVDAWRVASAAASAGEDFTARAHALGEATAHIHAAMADALGTQEATSVARQALMSSMHERAAAALREVPRLAPFADRIDAVYRRAHAASWPLLQRIHGDYHLGQVLDVPGQGWLAVDFEGEPLRPLAERVRPDLALRDVAGMLRSIDYAAGSAEQTPGSDARSWEQATRQAFLRGYTEATGRPLAEHLDLLTALELDKALYEAVYEARNRPQWLDIPVGAIARILPHTESEGDA